jgi:hypothetical protein
MGVTGLIEFEIGWSLLTINSLWRRLLCHLIEVNWRTTVLRGHFADTR